MIALITINATCSCTVGEGFALDNASQHTMNEIDRKLEGLMGSDEYASIMAAPSHLTYESVSPRLSILMSMHIIVVIGCSANGVTNHVVLLFCNQNAHGTLNH